MKQHTFLLLLIPSLLGACSSPDPSHNSTQLVKHNSMWLCACEMVARCRHQGIAASLPHAKPAHWRNFVRPHRQTRSPGVRCCSWLIRFCSGCTQYGGYFTYMDPDTYGELVGSQDCLCLNIWRPATESEDLSVFFRIHGGGSPSEKQELACMTAQTWHTTQM